MSRFFIFLLLYLVHNSTAGQDVSALNFFWKGDMDVQTFNYFKAHEELGASQFEFMANSELSATFGQRASFYATPQVIFNKLKARQRIDLREVYFSGVWDKFAFRIGKQIVDWGNLAGWSRSDMANRSRFFDFIDQENEALGIWAVYAKWQRKKNTIKLIGSPGSGVSKLYLQNNRWINLPNQMMHSTIGEVELDYLGYQIDNKSRQHQWGIEVSHQAKRLEYTLRYYHGYNDIPISYLDLAPVISSQKINYRVQLIYNNLESFSLQASSFLGDWNIWAETAYTTSRFLDDKNELQRAPFYTITGGTDRVFYAMTSESQLKLLLQYIHSFNTVSLVYATTDLDQVFQSALIAKADWTVNYNWNCSLTAVGEFKLKGFYLKTELTHNLNDSLEFSGGIELLRGASTSFFGHFKNNSRMLVRIKYAFYRNNKR